MLLLLLSLLSLLLLLLLRTLALLLLRALALLREWVRRTLLPRETPRALEEELLLVALERATEGTLRTHFRSSRNADEEEEGPAAVWEAAAASPTEDGSPLFFDVGAVEVVFA